MLDLADAHTAVSTLSGKRILVTGGTTGIGRAIAVLLASEGARLHVCGRTPEHLADAVGRISEVGTGAGLNVDLGEPGAPERYVKAASEWLGGLDVAVINAAIPAEGLTDMSDSELRYAIAVDFTAYLTSAHAAAEAMGAAGGDIVLIGSVSAHVLGPGSTVYAGIKAGIAGFAEALRKELGPKNIRVTLVEPALTQSDMHYPDIDAEKQKSMVREEKMLRSEDIAVAVHYALTQPRRAVVQQIVVAPRLSEGE
ncbi:SDR family oxidoreductase [Sphingomonas sp. NFR15]|uniref:SDR family oxidoreductase n=1 Tax=Sphingomonas sp. NFR15 TaxID=1566282 RepID=UPI00088759F9|nr:SDR family oxidoreductase [Sphingomonas sp. NFR15]SDA13935.1 NADP-dependent 3-hydroxy acid dehydrogenase YdfG [Sphingomonas sp. NFR15]